MFGRLQEWVSPVPEAVLGLGLLTLAAVFVWATLSGRRRERGRDDEGARAAPAAVAADGLDPATQQSNSDEPAMADGRPSCHDTDQGTAR